MATTSKLRRMGKLARSGVGAAAYRVLPIKRRRSTAAQVADTLGEMKGLAMKVGQHASYAQPHLSDEWKDALARLQQEAPTMGSRAAALMIEQELGASPDKLFAAWDPEPIGAATVGQVHRAELHDGTAVAVKVQYPQAAGALEADCDTMAMVVRKGARAAAERGSALQGPQLAGMLDVFKARMVQETDYHREADNQELIGAAFAGHPLIHVPRVFRELSSARVLTTELASGARFEEVLGWSQEERDLAGETIFRFHHECVFRVGHHNADPHPGNYVFRPGGQVSFLDFGAVWDVPRAFTDGLSRLMTVLPRAGVPPFAVRWFVDQVLTGGTRAFEPPKHSRPSLELNEDETAFVEGIAKMIGWRAAALDGMQSVLAALGSVRDWSAIAREILAESPRCAPRDATGTL